MECRFSMQCGFTIPHYDRSSRGQSHHTPGSEMPTRVLPHSISATATHNGNRFRRRLPLTADRLQPAIPIRKPLFLGGLDPASWAVLWSQTLAPLGASALPSLAWLRNHLSRGSLLAGSFPCMRPVGLKGLSATVVAGLVGALVRSGVAVVGPSPALAGMGAAVRPGGSRRGCVLRDTRGPVEWITRAGSGTAFGCQRRSL